MQLGIKVKKKGIGEKLIAVHTTLQASHYLPVRELHQTFNEKFPRAAY